MEMENGTEVEVWVSSSNIRNSDNKNNSIDLSRKPMKECRYACKEDEFAKVEFDFCIEYDNAKYESSKTKRQNNNCTNLDDYSSEWNTYINEYSDGNNEYIENSEYNNEHRQLVNELLW